MSEVGSGAVAPSTTSSSASAPIADASQVAATGAEDVQEILAEESADGGQQKTAAETKQEIKELKKKLKLKVHGKEVEKEIDVMNEKELRAMMEKALGADATFQEAAKIRKQMELVAQLMQEDPMALIREAGYDPDEVAAKYMESRLKEMEKSPEQKQLEELQKQVEAEKKRREALEREKQEAEEARVREAYSRDLDDQITDALSSAELPKSPYVVKRIAEYLSIALDHGKELSVKDVVPLVQKQIKNEIREMFEAMPEDVIEGVLGDGVLGKMKKRRLAKMKEVQSAAQIKPTGESEIAKIQANSTNKPKEKVNPRDFWNKIGK